MYKIVLLFIYVFFFLLWGVISLEKNNILY